MFTYQQIGAAVSVGTLVFQMGRFSSIQDNLWVRVAECERNVESNDQILQEMQSTLATLVERTTNIREEIMYIRRSVDELKKKP